MIIIDEHATRKLLHVLKSLSNLDGRYSIHILNDDNTNSAEWRSKLIDTAQQYLSPYHPHIYFCDEGDTYLLVEQASIRDCRKALFALGITPEVTQSQKSPSIQDLTTDAGSIINSLERRTEKYRIALEEEKKQHAERAASAITARKRHNILEQNITSSPEEIAAKRAGRQEPAIMIIEDDPFSRRLVENVVGKQYRLTGLATADLALSTYANLAPDILFLDINLPDVTGHELLTRIMSMDPEAYVIMLSGNADKENIIHAMDRGAKGFVAKPFSRDKLFQYIERCPTIHQKEQKS